MPRKLVPCLLLVAALAACRSAADPDPAATTAPPAEDKDSVAIDGIVVMGGRACTRSTC